MRLLRPFLLTVMVGLIVVGCGIRRESAMDMQAAAERSDAILDAVLREVRPELRWAHGPTTAGSCELTRRRVIMTDVSAARRGNLLGVVDRFWRKSGYQMTAVNNDEVFPAIYAQTRDGFSVSLRIGGKGQAFFQVDTPCVRESPVADSTSQATAPLYEGEFIPRPDIHSDFWSAETPEVGVTSGR